MTTTAEARVPLTPDYILPLPSDGEIQKLYVSLSPEQMIAALSSIGLAMCDLCSTKKIKVADMGPDYSVDEGEESPMPTKPDDPPACTRPYSIALKSDRSDGPKSGTVNMVVYSEQNPEVLEKLKCGLGHFIIAAMAAEQK